jgi:hypothetical protein
MSKKTKTGGDVVDFLSCAVTGASKGDIVRGVLSDELKVSKAGVRDTTKPCAHVEGVRLLVAEGYVRPEPARIEAVLEKHGPDGWTEKLGKHLGVTPSVAYQVRCKAERLASEPLLSKCATPNLGCVAQKPIADARAFTAKFVVLSTGTAWTSKELRKLADTGEVIDANALSHLLEKAHHDNPEHPAALGLRPHMWTRTIATRKLDAEEATKLGRLVGEGKATPLALDDDYKTDHLHVYYLQIDSNVSDPELDEEANANKGWPDGVYLRAPGSTTGRLEVDAMEAYVKDWAHKKFVAGGQVGHGWSSLDDSDVNWCWRVLKTCGSQAVYKSTIQKLTRQRPKTVCLPVQGGIPIDDLEGVVPYELVLMCAIALGMTRLGDTFNTDIGKYVRGTTAMFKRLAVSIIEDGGDVNAVPWLLGMALLTERDPAYHPPVEAIMTLYKIASQEDYDHEGGGVLLWRDKPLPTTVEGLKKGQLRQESFDINVDVCKQYEHVHAIFLNLGGMSGDKLMMRKAASMFTKALQCASPGTVPQLEMLEPVDWEATTADYAMPLSHIIDQHVVIGIMHANASVDEEEERDKDAMSKRFRKTWAVTGHNVRTHGVRIDEYDEDVMRVRYAQELVMDDLLREYYGPMPQREPEHHNEYVVPARRANAHVSVSSSALAGAIGDVQNLSVTTTREENVTDGMVLGSHIAYTRWSLIACFDTERDMVHVAHRPTAHANDVFRKPDLTERVINRARAEVWRRAAAGLPIKSSTLRGYTKAVCTAGGNWTLEGADGSTLLWPRESKEVQLPVSMRVLKRGPLEEISSRAKAQQMLADDDVIREAHAYVGPPGIVESREFAMEAVVSIVQALPHRQKRRLLSCVQNAYKAIVMPTCRRDGKSMGADQTDAVESGDWDVWRALVLIGRYVPAALRPWGMPKFMVTDARAMRLVTEWVRFAHGDVKRSVNSTYTKAWDAALEAVGDRMKAQGRSLTEYQQKCLDVMKSRDGDFDTRGTPVTLDTGLGKSIVAALYLARYISEHATAKHVLWFTQSSDLKGSGAAESHVAELKSWGFPKVVHVRTDPPFSTALTVLRDAVDANAQREHIKWPTIYVIGYELFSSGKDRDEFVGYLKKIAPMSVACFDEAHLLFNAGTKRGAAGLGIARMCARIVLTTATPTGTSRQKGARALFQLTTPFEVDDHNMLAAASRNLGGKQKRAIVEVDHVHMPDVSVEAQAASIVHAEARRWQQAAHCIRANMQPHVAKHAIDLALADRALAGHEDGGVLLVAETNEEAQSYVNAINAIRNKFAAIQDINSVDKNGAVGVVVQIPSKLISINLERLGAMLWLPTPSSYATRVQVRGRLLRELTQKRKRVHFHTDVPRGTVLEILHNRQQMAQSRAATYESVAADWAKRNPPSTPARAQA